MCGISSKFEPRKDVGTWIHALPYYLKVFGNDECFKIDACCTGDIAMCIDVELDGKE